MHLKLNDCFSINMLAAVFVVLLLSIDSWSYDNTVLFHNMWDTNTVSDSSVLPAYERNSTTSNYHLNQLLMQPQRWALLLGSSGAIVGSIIDYNASEILIPASAIFGIAGVALGVVGGTIDGTIRGYTYTKRKEQNFNFHTNKSYLGYLLRYELPQTPDKDTRYIQFDDIPSFGLVYRITSPSFICPTLIEASFSQYLLKAKNARENPYRGSFNKYELASYFKILEKKNNLLAYGLGLGYLAGTEEKAKIYIDSYSNDTSFGFSSPEVTHKISTPTVKAYLKYSYNVLDFVQFQISIGYDVYGLYNKLHYKNGMSYLQNFQIIPAISTFVF